MSQSQFPGGIDLLPGPQGPPIPANGLRIVTIGGALFTTIDGLTFTSIAGNVPLATPSAAGLMSAAQAASFFDVPAGANVDGWYWSAEVDITATSTGNALAPAITGKTFVPVRAVSFVTQVGGSISGAATINAGSSPDHNNMLIASTTAFGTAVFGQAPSSSLVLTPGGAGLVQSAAVVFDVAVAATGASIVYKGKIGIQGYYI